ncbi:hypothetical protein OUZ56_031600 [Daphnia magna]|uniref:Uncharacterized protein n=1 Tax=Daphnia magna TaxID=35525 RepID=A0ABQ9ZUN8_9CRUS|nr:hypothetical protein OUZ56_031600 [Daphnia magna]
MNDFGIILSILVRRGGIESARDNATRSHYNKCDLVLAAATSQFCHHPRNHAWRVAVTLLPGSLVQERFMMYVMYSHPPPGNRYVRIAAVEGQRFLGGHSVSHVT